MKKLTVVSFVVTVVFALLATKFIFAEEATQVVEAQEAVQDVQIPVEAEPSVDGTCPAEEEFADLLKDLEDGSDD